MQFAQLGLIRPLLLALERSGYEQPTPIQAQAIGPALAGRDLLGCAQTGTGKTAAFALPILQRLAQRGPVHGQRQVRALILTPTRELAAQVADSFRTYGKQLAIWTAQIHGGVSERPQIDALRRGVDVLVATPGRLLDLMNQGHVRLAGLEVLVLDEADRMLDMGFLPDVRRIVQRVPARRQTLLFSATLPNEIKDLARGLLDRPVEVSVAPPSTPAERVEQTIHLVEPDRKQALLEELLDSREVTRALVFTRTKHRANRVARALSKAGFKAEAIHGDKSQNARTRALENFQRGTIHVLVASDIASRGLDIDLVSHVFNFDLPNEPETYVHRIGRTGRAGASGLAVSFCARDERAYLRDIEKLLKKKLPIVGGTLTDDPAPRPEQQQQRQPQNGRRPEGGRGRRRRRPQPHPQQQAPRRHESRPAPRGGDARPPRPDDRRRPRSDRGDRGPRERGSPGDR